MRKTLLIIFWIIIISLSNVFTAFAEDVPFVAEFDKDLKLVSWAKLLVNPRFVTKLANNNYLVADYNYFLEVISSPVNEVSKIYLTYNSMAIGQFSDGNRLYFYDNRLAEYSNTGKKIKDIKKKIKIACARLINDKILMIDLNDPDILQLIDRNEKLIWCKIFSVKHIDITYNGNILLLLNDLKTIYEIDLKGTICDHFKFTRPMQSATKIGLNRYLIFLDKTNTIEIVDKNQKTLKKLNYSAPMTVTIFHNKHFAIFGDKVPLQDNKPLLYFKD